MTKRKGALVVISGPSGVGKTTVVKRLLETPGLVRSVSATTRPARLGEQDGRDYFFYSRERFERGIRDGEFLEYATINGHLYGTPLAPLSDAVAEGKTVILAIDVQGAEHLRRLGRPFLGVFLMPPSMEELERRLAGRGDTPSEEVKRRLALARHEVAQKDRYDVVVTNRTIPGTVEEILKVFKERYLL